ncbi:homospermidine synthase [Actinopolyspora mzabensis]|uniref:Homospermidine synthase n=1 Tax=Actinopolyspora mzabensis TaxID=995066 RepID=A0A1G9FPH7_ACTMZ|nr:saccharopine dehydrogenase NADP-binding domain-containing protein [Actinopolyspora mzabensis]SDK90314.1 homospermidine synthase [Actinopolyspora mzabensis]
MRADWRVEFTGRILLLGCGAVSRCLQPLLLRHLTMDFRELTIMDRVDSRTGAEPALARGARFVRHRLTRQNYPHTLARELGPGDVLINLTWDVDSRDLLWWCHRNGVRYLDTSLETWVSDGDSTTSAADRTTYRRHGKLNELAARLDPTGPTAVVEHGANPGLVSHLTKRALHDVATAVLADRNAVSGPAVDDDGALESALADGDHARIAMTTGTRAIHISERDTQRGEVPKEVDEFVNTWSVKGFYEEATAPAELGWGTHERELPPLAVTHETGPRNQIYLARTGMSTWVRSWVPSTGPMLGMMISHGETYTISDGLTVRDPSGLPTYRPTVHFAYLPSDAALASLHEFRMRGYRTQSRQRIVDDEIVAGSDELGVLLLGHGRNGWWTGTSLDIHQARSLVPGQNATTLQVAASALGALRWMLLHPNRGLCVPDELDHEEVLAAAEPYLGECPSVPTDWTPFDGADDRLDVPVRSSDEDDLWQFGNVLVR